MTKAQSRARRVLATVLAVLLFFGAMAIALPAEAEAADGVLVTDHVIDVRIKELQDKLGKTYWNIHHKRGDCGSKSSGHDCPNCRNADIIKQDWFKKLFGFKSLSADQFPLTYGTGKNNYIYATAYSCAGFANFAEWYIFRTSDSAKVETKKIGEYASTQDNWTKNAQKGDLIRWNGHSFIYLGNDKNGVKVLDCNWSGTEKDGKTKANNCYVQTHTIKYTWSKAKFTISRATTRCGCKHDKGYMTEWDGGTYVATVCKKCGRPFVFTVDRNVTGKASTTSNRPILHDQPYEDAKELYCFTSGVPLTVLGKVKNAYGNTWYLVRCTVSGKELEGYIYEKAMSGLSN